MAGVYQPFTDAGSQIRVVTIQPAPRDDPVSCTLETYTFAHAPRYEALSYCWGKEENLQAIRLQGVDWKVTPNLYGALKALRKKKEAKVMWIDALCINQEDKREKSAQVPLMGFIFKNARQVIAWLGDETEHTQEVFAFIEDLPAILKPDGVDVPITEECVRKWKGLWGSLELWEAILDLFERPYWSRLWVLQEYILSRKTVIRCGQHMLPQQSIIDFSRELANLRVFVTDNHLIDWISDPMVQVTVRFDEIMVFPMLASLASRGFFAVTTKPPGQNYSMRDSMQDSTSFFRLFISTSALQCKDPRDKIYAILGLTALHWREKYLSVEPDYDKAVSDVYKEFTLTHIKFTNSLRILEKAGLQRRSRNDLLSWVPDFTFDDTLSSPKYDYASNACGSLQVTFDCNVSGGLIVPALLCDTISSVTMSQNGKSLEGVFNFTIEKERARTGGQRIAPVRSTWDSLFCLLIPDADGIDASTCATLVPGFCHLFGSYRLSSLENSDPLPLTFNKRSFLDWYYILARGLQDFESTSEEDKWAFLRRDLPFQTAELVVPVEPVSDPEIEIRTFTSWAEFRYSEPMKIFRTTREFFGTTGNKAEVGDLVCVLPGAKNPFVLRKVSGSHQIVDHCYVPGMMHGEMVKLHEKGILPLEKVEIR